MPDVPLHEARVPKVIERRAQPRFPIDIRIWCETPAKTLYVPVVNVSPRGLGVRTRTPFRVGEVLSIRVGGGGASQIVVEAKVVWTQVESLMGPGRMGVFLLEAVPFFEHITNEASLVDARSRAGR